MAAHPPGPGLPRQAPSVMSWTFFTGASSGRHRLGLEELIHQVEDGGSLLRPVDGCAQLCAVPHAVSKVSGELFHLADRVPLALLDQHAVVLAHHAVAVLLRGLIVGAGFQVLADLAEDPRVRTGGASDHHGIAPGLVNHADGIFGGHDVTVADDWNLHGRFDLRDAAPVGPAGVALLAR